MTRRSWWLWLGLLVTPAQARRVPDKRPTDMERGQELFERHCVACHGPQNHGDGPATAALVHRVPDLAGKVVADDATIELVRTGKGAMPGYAASIVRSDTRRLLMYMAVAHETPTEPEDAPTEPEDPPPEPEDPATKPAPEPIAGPEVEIKR